MLAFAHRLSHTFHWLSPLWRCAALVSDGALMAGIDPAILAWLTPWLAAASAAVLVLLVCALVFGRARDGVLAASGRLLLVVMSAGLCGVLAWALLQNSTAGGRAAERLALEARAGQLSAQALSPGSALACLDAVAGEAIETACTKALFASPAGVAAAISYVAAQFTLLADIKTFSDRGGGDIGNTFEPLRRALEADPFGMLAHVLATRSGCTAENCPPLRLLHDASHVRTNLIAHTLDRYVDQYREAWAKSPELPLAELPGGAEPTGAIGLNAAGKRKVMVNIDFPNAASIPPISIMNPEPNGPAEPRAGANADPHKRAEKPVGREARQPGAAGPEQGNNTDPVWTPAPLQTR